MASVRFTFTLDAALAERARRLRITISAAERDGIAATVHAALVESDRSVDEKTPEVPDSFWDDARAW